MGDKAYFVDRNCHIMEEKTIMTLKSWDMIGSTLAIFLIPLSPGIVMKVLAD